MKKTKLSIYLDSLIISISISFVLFLWFEQKIKNAKFLIFCCIFINILLFFGIFKYMNNKFNLSKMKLGEQKLANIYLNQLIFSSDKFCENYFNSLLNTKQVHAKVFENNQAFFYINLKTISNENTFHYANDFYQNTNKNKLLIFIINESTDSFFHLISNSPTKYEVINFSELYTLMKHKNIFPNTATTIQDKYIKWKNFKNKAKQSLKRKSFFKFFISGFSLVILSIFIPFSFYYLVSGSMLLLFSILCLFNKNSLTQNSKIDLVSLSKKD